MVSSSHYFFSLARIRVPRDDGADSSTTQHTSFASIFQGPGNLAKESG